MSETAPASAQPTDAVVVDVVVENQQPAASSGHADDATSAGLAELLRSATRPQHEHAETRSFVTDLMSGGLGRDAYIALARQHVEIYRALEATGRRLSSDAVARDFVQPELMREPSLVADLELLAGAQWESIEVLAATRTYVARLAAVDAPGYVAHAYTRYLGDLSGGQIIARMLQRHYGLSAQELTFYTFVEIPKPKPFKDRYRELLDAAAFTPEQQQRCVEEAKVAFDLNAALFVELGERFPAATVAVAG